MITKLSGCLSAINFSERRSMRILDIGCGSGNATMALAKMFPDSQIIATDLSPELLAILIEKAGVEGITSRLTCVVADASTIKLKNDAFDIVCGSSMLHHLLNPELILESYLRSLKFDGIGLFFEPFHAGYLVLRQIIVSLKHLSKTNPGLEPGTLEILERMAFGIDFVTRSDRSHPLLAELDDKWLFSKEMFSRVASRAERQVKIYSANPTAEGLKGKLTSMLRSVNGQDMVWPEWANKYLDEIDSAEKNDLANDLLMEGCIIFN